MISGSRREIGRRGTQGNIDIYYTHRSIRHANLRSLFIAYKEPCFNCWESWQEPTLAMAIENRGPQVEAVAISFLTLSWIAVCLRCYVKLYMIRLFRLDDWLAVLSLVGLVCFLDGGVTDCLIGILHLFLRRRHCRCKNWHRTTHRRYLKGRLFESYDGKTRNPNGTCLS